MTVCASCGQETETERKLCQSCLHQKVGETWKRQMRIYSIAMLVGLLMLIYDYFQFTGHHYALSSAPLPLLVLMILGGLGLMGGLFGFSLAVFFQMWHGKAK